MAQTNSRKASGTCVFVSSLDVPVVAPLCPIASFPSAALLSSLPPGSLTDAEYLFQERKAVWDGFLLTGNSRDKEGDICDDTIAAKR